MRALHCEELIRIIDGILVTKTRAEWETLFKQNGVIYRRVETPEEVVNDPQALANDFFSEIHIPSVGDGRLVNTPIKFRQNPASIKGPAPEIGQHTEEILLELGYTWDDIARLKEQRVIL
jgi:crotonobetainyl-CoA:carnitine CoA-transferase CaiB-like acyl-CoA transferase